MSATRSGATTTYYLNHVGYKGRGISPPLLFFFPYYLNHVGYKGGIVIVVAAGNMGYYLNHVGYKGRK